MSDAVQYIGLVALAVLIFLIAAAVECCRSLIDRDEDDENN